MRLKNFLSLFAAACMAVSCTNEMTEIVPDDQPQENELRLVFSSSTDGEVYPTKAIATAEENEIKNLTIYVFGASSEGAADGSYYYIDKWESSDTQDNEQQKFVLQPSGANMKASIFPKQVTNAKYLKLYCVANSKVITSDNGTGEFTTSPGSALSGTTLSAFEGYYTEHITNAGSVIETPLAMTGFADAVHVTGNYGTVAVELKRRVARFDIDNNAARTKLTIQKISIENASASAYLFDTPSTGAYRYGSAKVNYPEVEYTKCENANLGVTPSAMYVYPTQKNDNLMLVIKGLYAGKNEVTYRLKVARTAEGSASATNIDIEPNHRYSLRISEVTTSEIVGYFEVEDWVDGGGVEVKPDYDQKPEMMEVKAVEGNDPFEGLDDGKSWTKADSTIRVAKAGKFTVTVKAPGQCSVKSAYVKDFVTRAVNESWLTPSGPTVTDEDGMCVSTFTFTVASNVETLNASPVTLTFVNNAASVDPAYQLVYRVLPPATLTNSNITASADGTYTDNSKNGSLTNSKGSEAMTLNVGKKFYVDVCSPYLAVPTCTELTEGGYLEITEAKRDAATRTVTYCFDLKSLPEDVKDGAAYTVKFTNTLDASGKDVAAPVSVDYKLTLNSTETQVNAQNPSDAETYANSEGSALTLTTATAPTGTITNTLNNKLYIAFAKEMVTEVPTDDQTYITVEQVAPKAKETATEYVYEIKIAKAYDSVVEPKSVAIKFKNKLDTRKVTTLTLTVNAAAGGSAAAMIRR